MRVGIRALPSALLALFLANAAPLLAQGTPIGGEFQVNTVTALHQTASRVARSSGGAFVVVFQTYDGSFSGSAARRYDAGGVAQGNEFLLNSVTLNTEGSPNVASTSAAGAFVAVWAGSSGGSYSGDQIKGRRYDSAGNPLDTPEFTVYTATNGFTQRTPSVAADSSGNFVVVWSDGIGGFQIWGQRYSSAGAPIGSRFQITRLTGEGSAFRPSVAMTPSGQFVVAWDSIGPEGDGYGISARLYNSSGTSIAGPFVVNTYTTANQEFAQVASDSSGNFVVVWENGSGGGQTDVHAQRYNSFGTAQGSQFTVNVITSSSDDTPSVAMDTVGNFVVVWGGRGRPQDPSFYEAVGRRYNPSGTPFGGEFFANTYTTYGQFNPAVAVDGSGNFVVTWGSQTQDSGTQGIYGQRFAQIVPVELRSFRVE